MKTVRTTFRDSILTLVNLDMANADIEEVQMNVENGPSMVGLDGEGQDEGSRGCNVDRDGVEEREGREGSRLIDGGYE